MHDHLSLSLEMDDNYRLSISTNALFLFFQCNISLSNSHHKNWEQNISYLNKFMGELENRSKEREGDIARLTQAREEKRTKPVVFQLPLSGHCKAFIHKTQFILPFISSSCQKKPSITFPTYWGSEPMYSSSTKNWFHTQPRLTRWKWGCLPGRWITFSVGCVAKVCCGCGWSGVRRPPSNRIQRSRHKEFLVSIGKDFLPR